jgi:hypothetical protein
MGFLNPYIGKIDQFIDFLTTEWKWIVTYDRTAGVIVADENKDYCVCPLHREGFVTSEKLCKCSEGFAERMFGMIIEHEVQAEVIRSYIRDKKSCIYEIRVIDTEIWACYNTDVLRIA